MAELIDFKNDVKELLDNNNDAGSSLDISKNLNYGNRVVEVLARKPDIAGQIATKFPCVFVHLSEYEQVLASLGAGASRDISFAVEIYACTNYGIGVTNGAVAAESECLVLTENIHDLLREKYNLDMKYATIVNTIRTSFAEEVGESTFVRMNKITVIGTQFIQ